MRAVRIHAIMCVRDEGDILQHTIDHLLQWVDSLYVLDTGSRDATCDILADAARDDQRVKFLGRWPILFHNGVRAWVFDRVRAVFHRGDWIVRADADEFYDTDPRSFLETRVRPHEHIVCAQLYEFMLLRRHFRQWRADPEGFARRPMFRLPPHRRPGWFVLNRYPEIRLMRYRPSLRWPATLERPRHLGPIARARIPIRHYRWRSPPQAVARVALRRAQAPGMPIGGSHWQSGDLRCAWVRPNARGVHRLRPGEPLPPIPEDRSHLEPLPKRCVMVALARLGLLGVLDRTRRGFDPAWRPDPLPQGDPNTPSVGPKTPTPTPARV